MFTQSSQEAVKIFDNEAEILMKLHHQNVVQFYGIVLKPMGIVMALAIHGSLSNFISKHKVQWPMKVRIENNHYML